MQKAKHLKTLLFTYLILCSLKTSTLQSQIVPYSGNPYYWQYKGKPLVLLGGSKEDNLFQIPNLESHLNDIQSVGANYVRNTMSDRHFSGWEVRAFHKRSDGKYDLNQWNSDYWTRFSNFLKWTSARNIIVQIEVWDRFDFYKKEWKESPYNPDNNVTYTQNGSGLAGDYPNHPNTNANPFFKTVPGIGNNTVILTFQQKFVDKMLSYTLQYNNILFCMDNETSGDARWGAYWSTYIKTKAGAAGKQVHTTEMWDNWDIKSSQHKQTLDHPETYSFCDLSQNNQNKDQAHWDNILWATNYISNNPRPINNVKTYGADGGPFGATRDGIERFWRSLIGGFAAMRFHRGYTGLGLSTTAKNTIKAARHLTNLVNLWEMAPQNNLLSNRHSDEAYLSANQGQAYALYFTDGGQVGLDLSAYPGSYLVYWINIAAGSLGTQIAINGGETVTITAPGTGHWAAAIIQQSIPLTACFSVLPNQGYAPLTVTLDASCSTAPNGNIIQSYAWDLGNGQTASGQAIQHTYTVAGTYTATLTITDDQNQTAVSNHTIQVLEAGKFSEIAYYGDASNYTPLNPSRWEVKEDNGSLRYYLNTTDYQSPGGNRLGEYSLINNRNISGDFALSLKTKCDENLSRNAWADIALVFNWTDDNNYCYVSLNSQPQREDATGFYKVTKGVRQTIASQGHGIVDNAYHNIELIRQAQTVNLVKDGQTICSSSDPKLGDSGQVGVGSYNDRVYFDDIQLTTGQSPPTPNPPNAPTALTGQALSGTSIQISWKDNSDNETTFSVERKQTGQTFVKIADVPANQVQFTELNLLPQTTYIYRVQAMNPDGFSNYSNEVSIATLALPQPNNTIFSHMDYSGDAANYMERQASRWKIKEDEENLRYFLNTTDYQSPGGDRLGEYSVLKNRTYSDDFTFSLKMKSNENLYKNTWADMALIFAFEDDQNYCYASLSSQQEKIGATGLYKIISGQRYVVKCEGHGIRDNQYHDITLQRSDKTMTLLREGHVLCSATDERFSKAGQIGVGSFNDGAYFDDINITASSPPPPDPEPDPEPPLTLTAYWPFNESSGTTANDASGNNHHAELKQGASFTTGKIQNALLLDGTDDRVDAGKFDISGGTGISIVAWIKADDFDVHDARIISKATGTATDDHDWMLSTINSSNTKLRFRLRTDGWTKTLIASSGTLKTNQWTHIAATWDGVTMRLYKDGALVGSTTKTGTYHSNPHVKVAIGNQPEGAENRPFDGRIDELAIYNNALSESDIQKLASGQSVQKLINHREKDVDITFVQPTNFLLYQNYPNPFNPETSILFDLHEDANVNIVIYDLNGKPVRHFGLGMQMTGHYDILWDGKDSNNRTVASGTYIYMIQATTEDQTFKAARKMMMMK